MKVFRSDIYDLIQMMKAETYGLEAEEHTYMPHAGMGRIHMLYSPEMK